MIKLFFLEKKKKKKDVHNIYDSYLTYTKIFNLFLKELILICLMEPWSIEVFWVWESMGYIISNVCLVKKLSLQQLWLITWSKTLVLFQKELIVI